MTGKRNRSRDGAGKSDNSWKKHDLIASAVGGQISAFRAKETRCGRFGRFLLVDGNASDGIGVQRQQLSLFDNDHSRPTAETLMQLARSDGRTDVVLSEKDAGKRTLLKQRFPDAIVIDNHAGAIDFVKPYHAYGLWCADPCGARDLGMAHMAAFAQRLGTADFVAAYNVGWLDRLAGVSATGDGPSDKAWQTSKDKYAHTVEPDWWRRELGRDCLSCTEPIRSSPNFIFRIFVISHFLAAPAKRRPFKVIQ